MVAVHICLAFFKVIKENLPRELLEKFFLLVVVYKPLLLAVTVGNWSRVKGTYRFLVPADPQ